LKPGDIGLDDLLNEAQFVLRDDGRRGALLLLRLVTRLYRIVRAIIRLILRIRWRSGALMPAPGFEPFNPSEKELESAWRNER
jgi:hypothetical protein